MNYVSLLSLFNTYGKQKSDPKRISAYSQVYSQHCEDGMLSEIFSRIGVGARTFLEIGIQTGQQNTTRLLLERGWKGIWVEGDAEMAKKASTLFASYIAKGHLRVVCAKVAVENINQLLDEIEAPSVFDLISVDIDQNTTHVWRALNRRCRVACVEYNASLPPNDAVEVPYDSTASWDGTNWFGGSLKALENIGRAKELCLVGCDPLGVNAFFVTKPEAVERFCEPFTAENHYEPPKYEMAAHIGHRPSAPAREWV